MDELIAQIISEVGNAGGSLTYPLLKAKIAPQKWSMLPTALKTARASNLLTQTVQLVDGVVVHTYRKV